MCVVLIYIFREKSTVYNQPDPQRLSLVSVNIFKQKRHMVTMIAEFACDLAEIIGEEIQLLKLCLAYRVQSWDGLDNGGLAEPCSWRPSLALDPTASDIVQLKEFPCFGYHTGPQKNNLETEEWTTNHQMSQRYYCTIHTIAKTLFFIFIKNIKPFFLTWQAMEKYPPTGFVSPFIGSALNPTIIWWNLFFSFPKGLIGTQFFVLQIMEPWPPLSKDF